MRWLDLIEQLVTRVASDGDMLDLLDGQHVYEATDLREPVVPCVTWSLVADAEGEALDTALVQWDIVAAVEDIAAIEVRLRSLVRWRTEQRLGGVTVLSTYEGGRSHPVEIVGRRHRSFDVRYQISR